MKTLFLSLVVTLAFGSLAQAGEYCAGTLKQGRQLQILSGNKILVLSTEDQNAEEVTGSEAKNKILAIKEMTETEYKGRSFLQLTGDDYALSLTNNEQVASLSFSHEKGALDLLKQLSDVNCIDESAPYYHD